MFKTFIVLLSLIVCLSSTALAQIKEAQVGNVVSIRSDFDYQDPKELALYEAQKNGNIESLVDIFQKCQKRLDEKLKDYMPIIEQVSREVE